MESNAFLKSMKVATSGSCLSLKPSVLFCKTWICWVQLRPGRKPAWFKENRLQERSNSVQQDYSPVVCLQWKNTLLQHWHNEVCDPLWRRNIVGVHLLAENMNVGCHLLSPSFRAPGEISLSSDAAFLFRPLMAFVVSSSVGGFNLTGRSAVAVAVV